MPAGVRKPVLWLCAAGLVLAAIEGLAFLSTLAAPGLYDHRDYVLRGFSPDTLQEFAQRRASPTLGWDALHGRQEMKDCTGTLRLYTVDSNRARVHGASSAESVQVVIAGDSLTFGAEADDLETFPAVVERQLGVPVANLGVGGYGPTQALLKLEERIDRYPRARIAVLAIMYENVLRMLNSYRPVYVQYDRIIYGFMPFMHEGVFRPLIVPDPWRSMDVARQAAHQAFDTDYWRKPRARFPFTVSLARAVAGQPLRIHGSTRLMRFAGQPTYAYVMRLPEVQQNLAALVERFVSFTRQRKLTPVVVLLPSNGDDTSSGEFLERTVIRRLADPPTVVLVGSGIDWERFNLKKGSFKCHPSAYGYGMIGSSVAAALRPLLGTRAQ